MSDYFDMGLYEEIRFFRFVEGEDNQMDECCEWSGAIHHSGRGVFQLDGKAEQSHRIAYFLANGNITPNLNVNHYCGNGKCCNKWHLYEGTDKQNSSDRGRDGNHLLGLKNPNAKLTFEQVKEAFELKSQGWKQKKIAKYFNVSQTGISSILRGLTRRIA